MRIAVISDIHGNIDALDAVLEDIQRYGVEDIFCLGDVVGYGASPKACLDRVQKHCRVLLRGNHEEALVHELYLQEMSSPAAQALHWTRQQLSENELQVLAAWPLVKVGADARLVHASPMDPIKFNYALDRFSYEMAFAKFPESLCLFGHTHIQAAAEEIVPGTLRWIKGTSFDLDPKCRYLVNVGSVGQPRDGNPQSRWVLVEDAPARITFHSVAYDVSAAQEKIHQAGLPDILATRLSEGR